MTSTPTRTFTKNPTPTSTCTLTPTPTPTATLTPTRTPTPPPDVEISKVASKGVASTDDIITYTLTLNVTGNPASNVQIQDVLPDYMVFLNFIGSVPGNGTASRSGSTLTWHWTTLEPGTYRLMYQTQVVDYVPQGTAMINQAQLTYAGLPLPKVAVAKVVMSTLYTVKVGVYNEAGELVKEIWVQELSQQILNIDLLTSPTITSLDGVVYVEVHGQQIAAWDGTNKNDDPVTNGKYYIKVDNIDPFGVVNSVSETVMVSRTIVKIEVKIYNEAGEVVRTLYSYQEDPGGEPGIEREPVDGSDQTDAGRDADGGERERGVHHAAQRSTDGVGREERRGVGGDERTLHGGSGLDGREGRPRGDHAGVVGAGGERFGVPGTVHAWPNVLKGGVGQTQLRVDSTMSFTLRTRLYDTAGELVKAPPAGGAGTNEVDLDCRGLSSGIYLAVTQITDAQGGLAGRQTTKILIEH